MATVSFIRIAGDRWNIPPRVNNRFPIRANFGEGVTLFDLTGKLWLPLDAEGYVDVTPGHNYLVVKLSQEAMLRKSQDAQDERKAKSKRMKDEDGAQLKQPSARNLFFSAMRQKWHGEGKPANDFKELHRLWGELPEEEKEKYRKLAAIKKENVQASAQSSKSVEISEKSSKAKKQKPNEKEAEKDPKKKSSKHSEAVTGTPQTLTAAVPSASQKSKEKHAKGVDTPKPTAVATSSQKLSKPAPAPTPILNEFASESSDEEELGSEEDDE